MSKCHRLALHVQERRLTQSYEKNCIDKRSIVTIRNDDELCAACALAVGIAHCEMKANPNCRELKLDYDLVKRSNRPFQKMCALELFERAGLTPGPVGLEDLDCFQNILTDYQIKVVSARHLNTIIYCGKSNSCKVIHLYLDQERGHFDVIVNMKAFVGGVYYCIDCEKSFCSNDFEHHSCPGKRCGCCKQLECEDFLNKNVNEHYEMLTCETCKRKFFGEQCLINHRSKSNTGCEVDIMSANCICRTFRKCTDCHINLKGKQKHECGKQECHVCGNMENLSTHKCFLQKADPQRKSRKKRVCIDDEDEDSESIRGSQEDVISEHEIKPLFVYADTEAMLDDDLHQPILLMASTNEDDEIVDFSGVDCVEQFLSWIQDLKDGDSKRDVIVLFHNLQSYDGYMILHELYNLCISPRLIVSGAKLLSITWDNVKFKDSLAFLPFPLATFPNTFGLREMKKGFYPYFFDTHENQSYVGPVPEKEMFDPDSMSSERREEFEAWYSSLNDENDTEYEFNLQREREEYCASDVKLLKEGCMTFCQDFESVAGFNPMEHATTIASACNLAYRRNWMPENKIAVEPIHGWRMTQQQSRQALEWLHFVDREIHHIEHAGNVGERRLHHGFDSFLVDGYDPHSNTVYEFHGCFYHGCPDCFPNRKQKHLKHNGLTTQEVYEKTLDKTKKLRTLGYSVIEKWSCQWEKEKTADPNIASYVKTLKIVEALNIRKPFFGGRTNMVCLHHLAEEDEEIRYIDITSLYPVDK